jgi:hypothetical protein
MTFSQDFSGQKGKLAALQSLESVKSQTKTGGRRLI